MRRVLVVDEDPDQLQTLCRGLRVLGMAAFPARTAAEAFAWLDGIGGACIDVLLADATFRGAAGVQVIERARAQRPGLGVLVLVGLALTPEAGALRAAGVPMLRKPFRPDELERAVEAASLRR